MNVKSEYDTTVKILVLGDQSVGKTKFIERFITNEFKSESTSTTCYDLANKTLIIDDENICVQLWDTAGQERYYSVSKSFYSKVHGIILIFDVTNRKSFNNLYKWIKDIREAYLKMPIIIIAHKCDLKDKREVNKNEIDMFCRKTRIIYREASSKNNFNIKEVVVYFVKVVLKSAKNNLVNDSFYLSKNESLVASKPKCCK